MIRTTLLASAALFLAFSASADVSSLVWREPLLTPEMNAAVIPFPRQEWMVRVKANLERSREKQFDLILDGDSITDFWQRQGADVWASRFGNLSTFNFGIAGDRTQQVLWRLMQGQAEGIRPKLIVLMIGTNNLSANTVEQIAEGVKAVVSEYQKRCPGAVILLQGILPRGEKPSDPLRAKINSINQIIAGLNDGKKVVYIDFGNRLLEPDGTLTRAVMPDFLHPSPKGYEIWADAIAPLIEQYVRDAPSAP